MGAGLSLARWSGNHPVRLDARAAEINEPVRNVGAANCRRRRLAARCHWLQQVCESIGTRRQSSGPQDSSTCHRHHARNHRSDSPRKLKHVDTNTITVRTPLRRMSGSVSQNPAARVIRPHAHASTSASTTRRDTSTPSGSVAQPSCRRSDLLFRQPADWRADSSLSATWRRLPDPGRCARPGPRCPNW